MSLFPSPWCTCTGGSIMALAGCVFRVWGYQNPWLISAESTILWGWVRTLDLAPCRTTRNHCGPVYTPGKSMEKWKAGQASEDYGRGPGLGMPTRDGRLATLLGRLLGSSGVPHWGAQDCFPLPPDLSLPAEEAGAVLSVQMCHNPDVGRGFKRCTHSETRIRV